MAKHVGVQGWSLCCDHKTKEHLSFAHLSVTERARQRCFSTTGWAMQEGGVAGAVGKGCNYVRRQLGQQFGAGYHIYKYMGVYTYVCSYIYNFDLT